MAPLSTAIPPGGSGTDRVRKNEPGPVAEDPRPGAVRLEAAVAPRLDPFQPALREGPQRGPRRVGAAVAAGEKVPRQDAAVDGQAERPAGDEPGDEENDEAERRPEVGVDPRRQPQQTEQRKAKAAQQHVEQRRGRQRDHHLNGVKRDEHDEEAGEVEDSQAEIHEEPRRPAERLGRSREGQTRPGERRARASPARASAGNPSPSSRFTSSSTIGLATTAESLFSCSSTKSIGFLSPGTAAPIVVLAANRKTRKRPVPQNQGRAYHGSSARAAAGVRHHRQAPSAETPSIGEIGTPVVSVIVRAISSPAVNWLRSSTDAAGDRGSARIARLLSGSASDPLTTRSARTHPLLSSFLHLERILMPDGCRGGGLGVLSGPLPMGARAEEARSAPMGALGPATPRREVRERGSSFRRGALALGI